MCERAGIGSGHLLGREHGSTPHSGVGAPRLLKWNLPRPCCCLSSWSSSSSSLCGCALCGCAVVCCFGEKFRGATFQNMNYFKAPAVQV